MERKYEYEKETNFLKLYMYHVGESEVPEVFHLWSAISLVASCLGNNIYMEKFRGSKMYPNLYVLLLGESSSGKGIAIDKVTEFADFEKSIVNPFQVSGTKRGSIELLARPKKYPDPWYHGSRIMMIAPELVNNIGSGPLADDWIRWMTAMFTHKGDYLDTTGMYGIKLLKDPMINWLAGSTEDWMRKSIPQDAITGGFFARTIVVPGEINYDRRIYEPTVPWDFAEVKEHLRTRIYSYCRCRSIGPMVLSPEAKIVDASWYMNRPKPTTESMSAIWGRQHDIILKVAMVLVICDLYIYDRNYDFTIKASHIQTARRLVEGIRANIEDIVMATMDGQENKYYKTVVKFIKEAKNGIQRAALLKKCYDHSGIGAGLLTQLIQTLVETGEVAIEYRGDRNAIWYVWLRKRLG